MAFVNEFVSEEDIAKHGLDELKKKYNEWSWRQGRPSTFTHSWVIDRERDAFVMQLFAWAETGQSGRSQPTTKETYLVHVHGREVLAVVDQVPGTWTSFSDSPFRITWNLIDIDMSAAPEVDRDQVVQLLKDALTAHGYGGARRQVPNTVVTFNF